MNERNHTYFSLKHCCQFSFLFFYFFYIQPHDYYNSYVDGNEHLHNVQIAFLFSFIYYYNTYLQQTKLKNESFYSLINRFMFFFLCYLNHNVIMYETKYKSILINIITTLRLTVMLFILYVKLK